MTRRPAARGSRTSCDSHAEYGASATSPDAPPAGAGSAAAHSRSGQLATALEGASGSASSTTSAAPACSRTTGRWSAPPGPAITTAATGSPTERAPSIVSSTWFARSGPPGATTTTVAPRWRAASRTSPSPSRRAASRPGALRTVTPSGAWRSSARTRSRLSNPCVVETSSSSGTTRQDRARPALAERRVDRRRLARDVTPVEAQHVLARLRDEPVAHRRIGEHERHHLRKRARVARGEAQPDVVVGHDLAQAAGVGHDARAAARHRLERDEPERLVQRRHDAQVGDPVERVQQVVADPPEEVPVRVEPEPSRLRLELGAVRARAGDEEPHAPDAADHAGQRVERDLEALLVDAPAGEQDEP